VTPTVYAAKGASGTTCHLAWTSILKEAQLWVPCSGYFTLGNHWEGSCRGFRAKRQKAFFHHIFIFQQAITVQISNPTNGCQLTKNLNMIILKVCLLYYYR
jgi:hypothetical protein